MATMSAATEGTMLNGWLVIDKPEGPGSTQIVSAVKRALREGGYARTKVGHGGTLDPLASGVLPVALGEATKLSGHMLGAHKAYKFTIAFGAETDTLDREGEVVATSASRPALAQIEALLPRFTGAIEQVPPAYSALKIDGKPAYARARAGEAVAMKSRLVTIQSLSIAPPAETLQEEPSHPKTVRPELVEGLSSSEQERKAVRQAHRERSSAEVVQGAEAAPGAGAAAEALSSITLLAHVSKGTYIRSLARDIAHALGTVGQVSYLRRLQAGPFTLEAAISLDKLSELAHGRQLEQALLPLTAGLDDIPALAVTPGQARLLRQGQRLAGIAAKPGLHLATECSVPVALVELSEGELRVVRGFNL
jgi:tRNA pseudouridine55 synthase